TRPPRPACPLYPNESAAATKSDGADARLPPGHARTMAARQGLCGEASNPFGNGERRPLALMVVASGCAFGRRSAALLAFANDPRYLHADCCHCLCPTVAPASLLLGRRARRHRA